jgi:hypothetical protein
MLPLTLTRDHLVTERPIEVDLAAEEIETALGGHPFLHHGIASVLFQGLEDPLFPAPYPATRAGNGGVGGYHQARPSAPAAPLCSDDAARTGHVLRADPTISRACAARNHPDLCGIDSSHDQGELPEGPGTVRRVCPRIAVAYRQ